MRDPGKQGDVAGEKKDAKQEEEPSLQDRQE
jgi:hypothetical protein